MSDGLVKRICQMWIADGRAKDCFWEGWPECPTPEHSLTPRMVLDCIEELEAKLAKAIAYNRFWSGEMDTVLAGRSDEEDRADAAEAKLAKAVEALGDWTVLLDHCSIEEGVCCCGEDMEGHSHPMDCGHSPVDHVAYFASNLYERTRAILTEINGGGDT